MVRRLNADPAIDGILVQLPVPKHIDSKAVIDAIAVEKDVDGFNPENLGLLAQRTPRLRPCTPYGCMKMLEHAGIDPQGHGCRGAGPVEHRGPPRRAGTADARRHRHHLPQPDEGPASVTCAAPTWSWPASASRNS